MRKRLDALLPTHLLAVAVALALGVAVATTIVAMASPWLGLRLAYDVGAGGAIILKSEGPAAAMPVGTVLVAARSASDRLGFEAEDFSIQPSGVFLTYLGFESFMARQDRLARIQAAQAVTFTDAAGRDWTVRPRAVRPLATLPLEFWINLAGSTIAWLISAAIWVFRREDRAARYMLLSGLSALVIYPSDVVGATREFALAAGLFRGLEDVNLLANGLFAAALAALLLYFPRRIAPAWAGLAIVGSACAWSGMQTMGLFEAATPARRLFMDVLLLTSVGLAVVQWRRARMDPIARGPMQWFMMAWLIGAAIYVAASIAPLALGVPTEGVRAFSPILALLGYSGMAFGILRFRIFDLGEWWARVLTGIISLVALVVLDLVFVLGLRFSEGVSLGLAVLAGGLMWLPIRGLVWNRFLAPIPADAAKASFQAVVEIAFVRDPAEQSRRWESVLRGLFDPLEVTPAGAAASAGLAENGQVLVMPDVAHLAGLRLSFAHGGRRLFTTRDAALAADIAGMLRFSLESRDAYDTGVSVERRRIASDLHDNLGGSLLSALHADGGQRKDELIRDTLAGLRSIVAAAPRPAAPLAEILADIRRECAERLDLYGVALDWRADEGHAMELASSTSHILRSMIREAVTNAIKHAKPGRVQVRVRPQSGVLIVEVSDDGRGFDWATTIGGEGLANIRSRLHGRGEVAWASTPSGGTTMTARLNLAG